MGLIQTLMDRVQDHSQPALPSGLRDMYDGNLSFSKSTAQRPYVISNFVSTLDGVVSYSMEGQAGGSPISGSDPADRFIMGLLRASVDAIIVGARTVQDAGPQSLWTPEYTCPNAKDLYKAYRVDVLHKSEYPILAIVSGSGNMNLNRAIFQTPGVRTIVITTSAGRDVLTNAGVTKLPSVQIHALDTSYGRITPLAMLQLLRTQYGVERLLHEGGPTLFGQFVQAGLVDELFLTLSPQIAGRSSDATRPALMQGTSFLPASAPWFQLLSLKQSADHLYLRYRRSGSRP